MIVSFCMVTCRSRMQIRCLREAKKIHILSDTYMLLIWHSPIALYNHYLHLELVVSQMLRAHNWAQISKSAWHPAVLTETFLWPDNQNCSAWWKLGSFENLATYFNAQMEAGFFRKAGSYITIPMTLYWSCKYIFLSYGHTVYHTCAHLKTFPLTLPYKL